MCVWALARIAKHSNFYSDRNEQKVVDMSKCLAYSALDYVYQWAYILW